MCIKKYTLIGYIVEASIRGRITFVQGVIILSIVMVCYESLCRLRSITWTDAMQGILLFVGCACVFGAINHQYGGLSTAAQQLLCQVAPAVFLGVHLRSLSSHAVLSGIIIGAYVMVGIMLASFAGLPVTMKPMGIHAGVWG